MRRTNVIITHGHSFWKNPVFWFWYLCPNDKLPNSMPKLCWPGPKRSIVLTEICPKFAKPSIQIAGPKNIQHNTMSKHVLQYREEVNFGHQVVPSKVFLVDMESILIVLWVKEQAKPIQRNGCHESLLLNRYFFYRSLNQKQSKWRKRTLLLLCLFEIESPINQPHCLPLKEVALMKFWEYYTWLYLILLYQFTLPCQ